MPAPIDRLIALEDIRRLKAEYFRCVDEKDWDALARVFTPDCEWDMRESVEPHNPDLLLHDAKISIKSTADVLHGVKTAHFGYMPRIDVLSDTEATGVWSMEDTLWASAKSPVLPQGRTHGWGHYHDRYVKKDGRWQIAATRLTRVAVEFDPAR